MKAIGFTTETDALLVQTEYLDAPEQTDAVAADESEHEKILHYLHSGLLITTLNVEMYDRSRRVSPYRFLTDGAWIWPGHFPYYVAKNKFVLRSDFLRHIRTTEYRPPNLSDNEKGRAHAFLELMLEPRIQKGISMKTVGFFQQQDAGIVHSEYWEAQAPARTAVVEKAEQEKILNYLRTGMMVLGLTLALADGDVHIGPYMILTDGEWIWPSHFPYYLTKDNFTRLTPAFLQHMRATDYQQPGLSDNEKQAGTLFCELKLLNASIPGWHLLKPR